MILFQYVSQKTHLLSGELAELAGVSSDTLRHYERLKLLAAPQRSAGNYRLYPATALDRVRLIRRAVGVGFSLAELARIFQVRDAGGAPCKQVKRLLEEKVDKLERQIGEMTAMRDHLRTVLRDWDRRLLSTPEGKPARLLETLAMPATKEKDHEKTSRARPVRNGAPVRPD